ncbi:DUF5683 domain-containing protein [Longitalea luteola]|uniref:DUF5683 domain-containing protein n=1 Tax=Longitalea luteola TaxID=2812563 RepID=UPI001A9772C7|nr:DUF5683 domain-containing protein [Longitalea luteola]
MKQLFFVIAIILTVPVLAWSQQKDSLVVTDTSGKVVASTKVKKGLWRDSAGNRVYSPRKAAIYSAVFPGLGQIYNRKYWKVPIVYAAIGIPIYTFFDNRTWYNRTRYALAVAEADPNSATYPDSLANVHSSLSTLVRQKQTNSLLNYRNDFRKNMDYSILFTLLFWGLNVVDATVDAHLKGFNVNENLSMQVKPAVLSNRAIGLSLVFKFDDKPSK